MRAPDAAMGAPATRRDMNADVAWGTTADVLAADVDAGDTTNPSAVAARARKAATATDFIVRFRKKRESGCVGGGNACKIYRAYVCSHRWHVSELHIIQRSSAASPVFGRDPPPGTGYLYRTPFLFCGWLPFLQHSMKRERSEEGNHNIKVS